MVANAQISIYDPSISLQYQRVLMKNRLMGVVEIRHTDTLLFQSVIPDIAIWE